MRSKSLALGLVTGTVFVAGCSLQKWDDVKVNTAGSAGIEQGGGGAGGEPATGGKPVKVSSIAKGGTKATNSADEVGGTGGSSGDVSHTTTKNTGGANSIGGSTAVGGTLSSGGVSNTGGTTAIGGSTAAGGTSSSGGVSNTGGKSNSGGTTVVGAPYVVSVTPTNGTTGVASNSKIVITFSEPMDTFSVASALSIPPLASNSFAQVWSTDNKILTITPSSGLTYATGASIASTPPLTYSVNLSATAADDGGTAMGAPYTSNFNTLRRITQTIVPEEVAGGTDYNYDPSASLRFCTGNEKFRTGCWRNQGSWGVYYIWLHYSLSSLGTLSDKTLFDSAVFNATQTTSGATLYPNYAVSLNEYDYRVLDYSIVKVPLNTTPATFCSSAAANPSISVVDKIRRGFTSGQSESLFGLVPTCTVPDERVSYMTEFTCDGFNMVVTFTTP
jgi:hypothetical protein